MTDTKALALRIRNTQALLSNLEQSIEARKKALAAEGLSAYKRADLELRQAVDEAKHREHSQWLQAQD